MIRELEEPLAGATPATNKIKQAALPALRNTTLWRHRDEILARVEAGGQADALAGMAETLALLRMHAFADCYYRAHTEIGLDELPEGSPEQKAHLDRAVREACLAEEIEARVCWHLRRLCIYHGITILEEKGGA